MCLLGNGKVCIKNGDKLHQSSDWSIQSILLLHQYDMIVDNAVDTCKLASILVREQEQRTARTF